MKLIATLIAELAKLEVETALGADGGDSTTRLAVFLFLTGSRPVRQGFSFLRCIVLQIRLSLGTQFKANTVKERVLSPARIGNSFLQTAHIAIAIQALLKLPA